MPERIARMGMKTICLIAATHVLVFMIFAARVDAQPRDKFRHTPGQVIHKLPPGHRTVYVGKSRYHVHGGHFYVERPTGFIAVRAPLGAVVVGIPVGSRAVLFGGLTFYVSNDVYYRKVPQGYMVVAPPSNVGRMQATSPVEPSQRVPGERVVVQATTLNVRSGPGFNFPVIQQIQRHAAVTVHGYAPEWLYVEMPDGAFGWVMLKYTSAYNQAASG